MQFNIDAMRAIACTEADPSLVDLEGDERGAAHLLFSLIGGQRATTSQRAIAFFPVFIFCFLQPC